MRLFGRRSVPYGPYEPANVYEAYYVWVLDKIWTLDDFRRYLASGRSKW